MMSQVLCRIEERVRVQGEKELLEDFIVLITQQQYLVQNIDFRWK